MWSFWYDKSEPANSQRGPRINGAKPMRFQTFSGIRTAPPCRRAWSQTGQKAVPATLQGTAIYKGDAEIGQRLERPVIRF
jgi:hypothetical protein